MELDKKALSAWAERRPKRTESERREVMLKMAAHLPPVDGIVFEDADIDALKAAFIHRFDEDLPRTETLFAVAQIGRRIEARHREQAVQEAVAERDARIEGLTIERDFHRETADLHAARIAELEADRARLRQLLVPFARAALQEIDNDG